MDQMVRLHLQQIKWKTIVGQTHPFGTASATQFSSALIFFFFKDMASGQQNLHHILSYSFGVIS